LLAQADRPDAQVLQCLFDDIFLETGGSPPHCALSCLPLPPCAAP
jgi:hypothetical protein